MLAEMFAQLLEARGFRVDRRPGLGATEIAFARAADDAIDVYPEYTGTGLLAILGDTTRRTPRAGVRITCRAEFRARVRRALACRRSVSRTRMRSACGARRRPIHCISRTLSDLARVAPSLRAAHGGLHRPRRRTCPASRARTA